MFTVTKLSEKNAIKKLDFTLKNVINCVHNEPALWDTKCTDVDPEITTRIDSATHIIGFLFLEA